MSGRLTGRLAAALATVALLPLAACRDGAETETEQASSQPSDQTLAALLAGSDELSIVSEAVTAAGLAEVFDGPASYTLLAPQDAAFAKLGDAAAALRTPEQRPAMAAILRDHIVPGYLTPQDIQAALDRNGGDAVKMRTMGDHVVSFTREGDAIVVTREDGLTARVAGEALLAGNGVALPIDTVLKKIG